MIRYHSCPNSPEIENLTRCHVVHVDGRSYRLREMEQRTLPALRKEE